MREKKKKKVAETNYQLRGVGSIEELVIDGEAALLDGGSEVAASLRSILVVEGRERVQRRQ